MRCNTLNLDLVNISQLRQHGSKCFTPRPAPDSGGVIKGQNSTISELGHVSYQVKWNQKCSNMVAIIIPADPTPFPPPAFRRYGGWDQGVKVQKFQNMVMLHIN